MAYSYANYTGNGTTSVFSVPFSFLERANVKVSMDDTEITAWSWITNASIRLTPAPPKGAILRIQRFTEKRFAVVDFQDGSVFKESDLDLMVTQLLFIAQEAYDALDGETAVAAKEKAYEYMLECERLWLKMKHEADLFRSMKVYLDNSEDSPGTAKYDYEKGILHLFIPPAPQGPMGPEGPQGLPGAIGPEGPRGIQGPQGIQGERGPEGQQGPMGPQGDQGPRGETGFTGPAGPTGLQGNTGPQGEQGPRGETGPIGPQGADGIQGPIGLQGEQGPRGETGPVGPVGPQGLKGDTGERGMQGPEGPKGMTGDKGALGDSPLAMAFGNFNIDAEGFLCFQYYGDVNQQDFRINDNGELEVNF